MRAEFGAAADEAGGAPVIRTIVNDDTGSAQGNRLRKFFMRL
jgi:hypothetical protein